MHGRAPSTLISPSHDEGDCQAANAASRLAAVGYRIEIAVSALDRNYKRSIRLPLTGRCYQRGSSNDQLVSPPPADMQASAARKKPKSVIIKIVKQTINSIGYDLVKKSPCEAQVIFPDLDGDIVDTFRVVQPYTMTSLERVNALCLAAKYIVKANIQGDVVECGGWKGGSMMAAARTLAQAGDQSRNLYFFDTYEGMTEAADRDVAYNGVPAAHIAKQIGCKWCYGPLDEVREVLHSAGYDLAKIHFIIGPVDDTIPAQAPVSIALLRLDTDLYQSTKHEL